jgi:hypothetical protein
MYRKTKILNYLLVETNRSVIDKGASYVINGETYVKGGTIKFNDYYYTITSDINLSKSFKGVHKLFFTISESQAKHI